MRIVLDARTGASLDWDAAMARAQEAVDGGSKILWELDMGLFAGLKLPLSNEGQFRSFVLSLDHFCNTVWERFSSVSTGICLYRGKADFDKKMPCEDDGKGDLLCAAKAAFDYIDALAYTLQDSIPCFVELDVAEIRDPLLLARMFSSEHRGRILLSLEGSMIPLGDCNLEETRIGVCFPSAEACDEEVFAPFTALFAALGARPYRIIPESTLTAHWDGLDAIIVSGNGLSAAGRRMLQGFAAAGGEIVTFGGPIGIFDELSFEEWSRDQVES